jgi:ribosomal protein L13
MGKRRALRSVGHGPIYSRRIRLGQKTVIIKGQKKKITRSNIRGGRIYWYKRSDTGKIALRRFSSDRKRRATRRAMRHRGYSGD